MKKFIWPFYFCHEFHELARIKFVEIREIRGNFIFTPPTSPSIPELFL